MADHESTFRYFVGSVIVVAWLASIIVDMRVEAYDPPAIFGVLMPVIATAVFSKGVIDEVRRRADRSDK